MAICNCNGTCYITGHCVTRDSAISFASTHHFGSCQCPCHLTVWTGTYPPICTCSCGKGNWQTIDLPMKPRGICPHGRIEKLKDCEQCEKKRMDKDEILQNLQRAHTLQVEENRKVSRVMQNLFDKVAELSNTVTKLSQDTPFECPVCDGFGFIVVNEEKTKCNGCKGTSIVWRNKQ